MKLPLVILVSITAGLAVPIEFKFNAAAILFLLAAMTFFSPSQPFHDLKSNPINVSSMLVFCVLRFIFIPCFFYACLVQQDKNVATFLALLAAMPVGIAAPSLSGLSKGNVALATCLLMISTGLSLLIFPMFGFLLFSIDTQVGLGEISFAIIIAVVIPLFLRSLEHHYLSLGGLKKHGHQIALVFLAIVVFITSSDSRDILIKDPVSSCISLFFIVFCFYAFYAVGYLYALTKPESIRKSYTVTSGFNNNVLGISLTALYFNGEVQALMLLSNLACSIAFATIRIPVRF